MSGIVCAVRGGPASQPTIQRAIALAKETGLPLFFLYVVNLDFLDSTTRSRTHTISKEMAQMGEFILLMAKSKAEAQGVPLVEVQHFAAGECTVVDAHVVETAVKVRPASAIVPLADAQVAFGGAM